MYFQMVDNNYRGSFQNAFVYCLCMWPVVCNVLGWLTLFGCLLKCCCYKSSGPFLTVNKLQETLLWRAVLIMVITLNLYVAPSSSCVVCQEANRKSCCKIFQDLLHPDSPFCWSRDPKQIRVTFPCHVQLEEMQVFTIRTDQNETKHDKYLKQEQGIWEGLGIIIW